MKSEWTPAFFSSLTQYSPDQQCVMDRFVQTLPEDNDLHWIYETAYIQQHLYIWYENEAYALRDISEMQPVSGEEFLVPFVHQGRLLLNLSGKVATLAYLSKAKQLDWQVVFLKAEKRKT